LRLTLFPVPGKLLSVPPSKAGYESSLFEGSHYDFSQLASQIQPFLFEQEWNMVGLKHNWAIPPRKKGLA
jgi:hypothetical protein